MTAKALLRGQESILEGACSLVEASDDDGDFRAAFAAVLLVSGAADAGVTKGRINETGQTTGYGPGSDGDLKPGLTRIFNDLGNGVVKDARTGLFWEKKSDDGSIHDKDNTYSWWDGMGTTFLAALNTSPCFAGHCDWRIPNKMELDSISNLETFDPATFPAFNTGCSGGCTVTTCSCTYGSLHWSSSTNRGYPYYAWLVGFYNGYDDFAFKTLNYYVRAVRGGS